ncbi:unnamed protein product [Vitrella brassicaformis CCMP3155]|uniref:Uncharacterized protein n=1 Tax=Vitrella brassicaformis (strain CCMP3155) TaxID=1169540 RepID=A0A0G4EIW7_VITBC|nr:unnamed protein product [Vitrella brassicaformis CCMP3155]|eukprot:CEL95849.1 unnamed protein product [Vitrella brassicaformis CCMP3155]
MVCSKLTNPLPDQADQCTQETTAPAATVPAPRLRELEETAAWYQIGADIDGEAAGDRSGIAVAISSDGSRLAIGADYNDGGGSDSSHVRVFDLTGSTWTQVGADIDGKAAGDQSGYSVAMSSDGSRLAIGAYWNDAGGYASGHVRVFDLVESTWTQVGADIDGLAAYDQSGYSVAMSSDGSRLAIGAWGNDDGGSDSGHVRVFDLVESTWTQVGADIDGEAADDWSGAAVAMSSDGSRLAIGAPYHFGSSLDSGHVRVFDLVESTWTQVGADIDGEAVFDNSGYSVAMSSDGSRLAIGTQGNNGGGSGRGHVRVFDLVESTWTQVGVDIDGEADDDRSGQSVAMSSDGSRLAIGAWGNDGGGSLSGHVRVFDLVESTWTQVGADIDGEAANDQSRRSVAMSSDGSSFAIGAPRNGGGGSDSGHVRVFTTTPQLTLTTAAPSTASLTSAAASTISLTSAEPSTESLTSAEPSTELPTTTPATTSAPTISSETPTPTSSMLISDLLADGHIMVDSVTPDDQEDAAAVCHISFTTRVSCIAANYPKRITLAEDSPVTDVEGTSYDDIITGNARDNTLEGGNGNDTIVSGGGDDILLGMQGADML